MKSKTCSRLGRQGEGCRTCGTRQSRKEITAVFLYFAMGPRAASREDVSAAHSLVDCRNSSCWKAFDSMLNMDGSKVDEQTQHSIAICGSSKPRPSQQRPEQRDNMARDYLLAMAGVCSPIFAE